MIAHVTRSPLENLFERSGFDCNLKEIVKVKPPFNSRIVEILKKYLIVD